MSGFQPGDRVFASKAPEHLLKTAIRNARSTNHNKGVKHPRWVAVMDALGLGSGYAQEMCAWAGVDPDEAVKR